MPVAPGTIDVSTPTLTVLDPRGLTVRSVAYCRSVETVEPEERINRNACDALGRLVEQWDPRLWALRAEDTATPANLKNRYSLSGKVLASISVDAGGRISLFGDGDQLLQSWDSRGTERRIQYDELLRPLAIIEQGEGEAPRCSERYEYADRGADFAVHNQCGQLIRHDDPVGTQTLDDYALAGGVLEQTQRFLLSLDLPDWPSARPERDALLEPLAQAASSASRFNPLGDISEQTDAKGNRQSFDYTVDGVLFATHLQLSDQTSPRTLASDIAYGAYGQVEQETAGNGVVSTLTYRPEDGRLTRLQALHGSEILQDLRYDYDPVGNVLSIEDAALPIRFFANQRVEPVKRYRYDTLYQLLEATGWEAGAASRGPGFNRFDDPGAIANYRQTYHYDAGGNLLELIHVGPQNHSRKLTAARYSNRCLPEQNDRPPTEEEIVAAFDGNGNLLELQPGQAMGWDLRNQLSEVRPIEREDRADDSELYRYGSDGMRRRKVRTNQINARSLISEVRYLPGLEIRIRSITGEVLQVISVQAGRSAMQVLHWEATPPSGIANDQYRYNLTDHLGSSSLELDDEAQMISQEAYHPYGSTAWFAGRSEVEAGYKTVRYSGKERDATGLYYYGFRYYATWLCRWINPDPSGTTDGLNLFAMVGNRPVLFQDERGLNGEDSVLAKPEQLGKWRLERLQLTHSELKSKKMIGHNVIANLVVSYNPSLMDRWLGRFEEVPSLIWYEKIKMNDFSKGQRWEFEADMVKHNPSSRTMEIWPRRYLEAFNTSAGNPGLARGTVVLQDLAGEKVKLDALGGELFSNEEKAHSVRSYLSGNGGILAFEIHDVPSIVLSEDSHVHKERLLDIRVGLAGASTTASIKQYLYVNDAQAPMQLQQMIGAKSFEMQDGLSPVDAPTQVSTRRPYIKFQGEY
ncbi:RHS repeat-associated core domain-containing protein [Pseudomonas sp. RGM2987]|uniref:RHS repeat domain-containing protein n=1 Tax=Pseudomonas sp. RGM2987 TaxID=2930090 RepID=UPI001FD6972C|nr:RHS repeat-associated core domain-containing protein [Pseudomonas sp. RGM2987]MCJ8207911.1 toxin [Pseudomonas sp. RGM2987]